MPEVIASTKPPYRRRSRITSGRKLLPGVHGQSVWARIMGDTLDDVLAHCGGADHVSTLKRMAARRIAALEAELVHLEEKFARTRAADEEPSAADLDLYSRLTNTHRRQCEALGWERVARDITGKVTAYTRTAVPDDEGTE
jgi:hypothetical protein